ncbi:hypothetical protein ABZ665_33380, partial [Streptomyces sp. NPDC007049]|uniref:hypothetical protein n=1 Tax=Streptomyces sp. NPDC007049 TaxID=3156912 RepID=UPI0033C7550F
MPLWVNQAQADVGEKDGLTSAEQDEPARPQRDNRSFASAHRAATLAASSLATSGTGPPEQSSVPPQ